MQEVEFMYMRYKRFNLKWYIVTIVYKQSACSCKIIFMDWSQKKLSFLKLIVVEVQTFISAQHCSFMLYSQILRFTLIISFEVSLRFQWTELNLNLADWPNCVLLFYNTYPKC